MDHEAVLGRALGKVPLMPQPLEPVEVGGVVPLVVGVVPEAQGHGRERLPAHQLASDADPGGGAAVVDHVHVHAQHRTLDLSGVDRSGGLAAHQASAEVGAAGDGRQVHVRRPVGVHVGEALVAERAAGGADGSKVSQRVGIDGPQSSGSHRVDELGRNPEQGEGTIVDQVE